MLAKLKENQIKVIIDCNPKMMEIFESKEIFLDEINYEEIKSHEQKE